MSISNAGESRCAAVKGWLTYTLMRIMAAPARHMPLHGPYPALDGLAAGLWHVFPRVRAGLLHNVSHAMGVRPDDPAAVTAARTAYGHLWLNTLDLLRAPALSAEALADVVTIDGEATLRQVRDTAGRAILVTGHFAGGELALQAMAAAGWTAHLPVERLCPPAFFDWVCHLRSRHGHHLVASDALLKPLIRVLRTGGGVMLTLDRDLTQRGTPVELCGAVARLPAGAAILSARYGAPLIPMHVRRLANGHVIVSVGEPLCCETGASRSRSHPQTLADVLEPMITAAPDQWVLTTPLWDSTISA